MPRHDEASGVTLLGAMVWTLGAWIVGTNLWANPSYTAAAPYMAGFLVGGFLLGRRADSARSSVLFSLALVFACAASVWGLWQWWAQDEMRAHSVFVTPATLGALVNLVFVPGLVLYVLGSRSRALSPVLIVLAVALGLAQSRGAWIALAVAVMIALALIKRGQLAAHRRRMAIAAGIVALGVLTSWIAGLRGEAAGTSAAITGTLSFAHRLQLYDLALKSIADAPWLFGTGYQSFYYVLEASRLSVPAYIESQTYFVHNDYLQFLLELGVPGLSALFMLVALPVLHSLRSLTKSELSIPERTTLVAAAAATVSMAVHALGDFPFYIPVCVLLYGAALGIQETIFLHADCGRVSLPPPLRNVTLRRILGAAVGTVAAWLLAIPALAEGASEYGVRRWQEGKGREVALAFESARRLDPKDWRYHWYAGQFWMAEARNRADPTAATYADRALATAESANPREVRPLYDRILLHRQLKNVLAAPADGQTLLQWADRAVSLAPADPVVRAQREGLLRELGK